ncbi:3-deoxy-7-phosphoheptulonate synthase [Halorhodospira halophila]|uniref:Phospho-2-dehydro-3-deoxyheptonate aldolase n=1 Tax=Halorhodospira halophila (strain DSM 244 / SL1) TaxID=349124 RepID=A1WVR0_HALHL|nr:3-deoxy-7-phosphoheptulonate synthase [Halorhodospira halophila]ABM61772.1 3-deoxy-D-arabinoheptulosonate-7-phosphate synthase [Halorhodospira halophila SL1]MBK1728899.1 3-deoxy-7-phosphoheptulonate synthase [Halorhodospira halophila]
MQESDHVNDVNVATGERLPSPAEIKSEVPLTDAARQTVLDGRQVLRDILDGKDQRIFAVVGPCSIHDPEAALDYARRLKALHDELSDHIYLVMRVYFEKPRTTTGWKGLINDPDMDDSFRIDKGLRMGRELLREIAAMGLPTATEALDPYAPQYYGDLVSWTAIGARTTESQTHREMASGLSTPVGFKNATDGSQTVAINALQSAASPHSFLGIDQEGRITVIRTRGNQYGHVVLRGGAQPNYDSVSIRLCEQALEKAGMPLRVVVDCSHSNSNKDPGLQSMVLEDVIRQLREGNRSIVGVMLESNIGWGSQKLGADPGALDYGISITDACIDWETTEQVLRDAAGQLRGSLRERELL